jgi:hypothetical protein
MTVGATLVASLLVTLARPATWPLALATFLLRGGFLLVLAPIVVLPSAVAVGNVITPLISSIVFQGVSPSIVAMLATVAVLVLLWLFGVGLVAAAAEAELVRQVAAEEETWPAGRGPGELPPGRRVAWRVLAVRLVAQAPLVAALALGAVRIVSVAYGELTNPSDVAVALAIRVALGALDAVVLVVLVWLVGETVGSIAARRVVLRGEGVLRSLRGGVVQLLRRPVRWIVLAPVSLLPLVLALVAVGFAGSAAWDALRAALSLGAEPLVALVSLVALVGLFGGGLLLIGVCCSWRGAIWTVEEAGTFGATTNDPEGHWIGAVDSGTLADLRPRGVDPDTR